MKGSFFSIKLVRKMLVKIGSISRGFILRHAADDDLHEDGRSLPLPLDVKEGHFVVHTIGDGEVRRFIIELQYLAHPEFLKLLAQAEEEFGFEQEGVLAVPCKHSELETILRGRG